MAESNYLKISSRLQEKADAEFSSPPTQYYLKEISVNYKSSSTKEHMEQDKLQILHSVNLFVLDNLDSTCQPTAQNLAKWKHRKKKTGKTEGNQLSIHRCWNLCRKAFTFNGYKFPVRNMRQVSQSTQTLL